MELLIIIIQSPWDIHLRILCNINYYFRDLCHEHNPLVILPAPNPGWALVTRKTFKSFVQSAMLTQMLGQSGILASNTMSE
jgi:hypothetical protein